MNSNLQSTMNCCSYSLAKNPFPVKTRVPHIILLQTKHGHPGMYCVKLFLKIIFCGVVMVLTYEMLRSIYFDE